MEDSRSSKVHPLFPHQAQERAERAAYESVAHPVAAELKAAAQKVLDELLLRMFESADDYLFEMGEKSLNDNERRRYFDTMRVLRLDRAKVTLAFGEDLVRGFAPAPRQVRPQAQEFDLDSLSIQPTEELEEKIALTNMATKAEGLHKTRIWEIERRLEIAARELGLPLSPVALSPARICEAFGKGTAALATDFSIKLVVYKLFDRVVIQDLGRLYNAALEVLDRHGINATRRPLPQPPPPPPMSPPPPPPAAAGMPGAAPGMPGAQAPGYTPPGYAPPGYQPPGYAPPGAAPAAGWNPQNWNAAATPGWGAAQTQEFLRNFGLDQLTLQRSAGPLAAEFSSLLQALFTEPPPPALQASAQRLTLAGKLFDDILSEPLLPEPLRPAIEKLRYPVYRTALTDANFFANQAHPLRKLLSDLVELSVSAQSSETAQQQLREVLRAAAALHSEGPALLPDAVRSTQPVAETDVELFLQQMREQTRSRRDALLMRVRRLVAQELEVQTLGREVPQPVMQLLRGGVGPLMAVRLLKNGRGSPLYREAQGLMERVLRSLEFIPPPTEDELRSREQLMSSIVTSLADIGMPEDRIESLLNGLQGVYTLLDQPERMRRASDRAGERPGDRAGERRAERPERPPTADTAAPAPPPAAERGELPTARVMELLQRVLVPDSWFRVYHAEQNQTRWLKLNSFYPERDAVTFTGFDETQKLNLRAYRFAEDLARGHSEPINPDESARDAVDQLREAKALGLI